MHPSRPGSLLGPQSFAADMNGTAAHMRHDSRLQQVLPTNSLTVLSTLSTGTVTQCNIGLNKTHTHLPWHDSWHKRSSEMRTELADGPLWFSKC